MSHTKKKEKIFKTTQEVDDYFYPKSSSKLFVDEMENIEDITKKWFFKTRGLGKVSWKEFVSLRGY